ncbi:MAG TPA: hypothetical protein PLO07_08690 [Rubrivivax sp.]|nr:hypothetical protein [Rubrivivax sp.]
MSLKLRTHRVAVALVAALLLEGCAVTHTVDAARLPDASAPALVEQLPVMVGVHHAAGVRETIALPADLARIPIGAEVISTFDWALRQMFTGVVAVAEPPPGRAAPPGIAGIVVLTRVQPSIGQPLLTYSIELHSHEGSLLDQWEMTGFASKDPFTEPILVPFGALAAWSIRDATAAFMVDLPQRPAVRDWQAAAGRAADTAAAPIPPTHPAAPGGAAVAFVREAGDWSYGEASDAQACVVPRFRALAPTVPVVPFDRLRLALFPWLEFSTAPRTEEALLDLLARPDVEQRISELGLRCLVFAGGTTTTAFDQGGIGCVAGPAPGAGCYGFAWGTRDSSYRATVVDLTRAFDPVRQAARRQAGVFMPAFILPVPIIGATKSAACEELARRVRDIVAGSASAP